MFTLKKLKHLKNKKGLVSMIEVIVTAIIFTIAAFGILATISMFQPQTTRSAYRLEAAYAGQSFLEELRNEINAETWDSGMLRLGTWGPVSGFGTGGKYTIEYTVTEPIPGKLRRVDMDVTFTDPSN